MELKITKIRNSLGLILPQELAARLKLTDGQALFISEGPGGFSISPNPPEVEEQLRLGRQFMAEYRPAFEVLAK